MSAADKGGYVKDTPLLFSGPMSLANLSGKKSMTRRTRGLQLLNSYLGLVKIAGDKFTTNNGFSYQKLPPCPYGQPGDRIWQKETTHKQDDGYAAYSADGKKVLIGVPSISQGVLWDYPRRVRPSIHMRRWECRCEFEITEIRIERLHDISEEDAIAEGLSAITKDGTMVKYGIPDRDGLPGTDDYGWPWTEWCRDPRDAYRKLWEQVNGLGSWNHNSWVWVISYRPIGNRLGTVTPDVSADKYTHITE